LPSVGELWRGRVVKPNFRDRPEVTHYPNRCVDTYDYRARRAIQAFVERDHATGAAETAHFGAQFVVLEDRAYTTNEIDGNRLSAKEPPTHHANHQLLGTVCRAPENDGPAHGVASRQAKEFDTRAQPSRDCAATFYSHCEAVEPNNFERIGVL